MQPITLSVVLITRNEAHNIGACLDSVAFADEWIVVDSGSTDATQDIARQFGAQFVATEDWPGFGAQKNRALERARGDWVLSIDADERVTPKLKVELLKSIAAGATDACEVGRLSQYCGHFMHHGGWTPDRLVRLWRRGTARFSDDAIHERVVLEAGARIIRLGAPLLHLGDPAPGAFLNKLARYGDAWAEQQHARGRRGSLAGAVAHAAWGFVARYLFRAGFLDGRWGLAAALSHAFSVYHKHFCLALLTWRARDGRTG